MAVCDSKKLKLDKSLEKLDIEGKSVEKNIKNVALVHKNKNHRVIKELRFESKMNNSKLT
ncbi:hypothetical protein [Maribacter dokdonensis]|uniref:hypothetical protein n=1 Tax=Maribacter dokdonensis TaxID=320912 RepID=UPI000719912D|nr:hypothetical protein [Maribacter dokdonensis]KSA15301.1 hypothetical protein I600_1914 [Maribacter dokdonensis DSW-8]